MKTEQTPKHTTICPECGGPADLSWSGLDLVEQTGDETLARKHYKTIAHTLKALNNELLEALEESTIHIKYLHEKSVKSGSTGTENAVISRNESIISKCKDL